MLQLHDKSAIVLSTFILKMANNLKIYIYTIICLDKVVQKDLRSVSLQAANIILLLFCLKVIAFIEKSRLCCRVKKDFGRIISLLMLPT